MKRLMWFAAGAAAGVGGTAYAKRKAREEEKRKADAKKASRTKVKPTQKELIEARKVFDSSRVAQAHGCSTHD